MIPKEKLKEFEKDILDLQTMDQKINLREKEYELLKSIKNLVKTPIKNGNEIYQFLPQNILDLASEERMERYKGETFVLIQKRKNDSHEYEKKYITEYIKQRPSFKEWMIKNNTTLLSNVMVSHPHYSSGDNLYQYVRIGEKYKTTIQTPPFYGMSWKYLGSYKNAEILLHKNSISFSEFEESVFIKSGHLFIPKKNMIIKADFSTGK